MRALRPSIGGRGLAAVFLVLLPAPCMSGRELPQATAPILVLTDQAYQSNPFANYLCEILRGEGLVAFQQVDRSVLRAAEDPEAFLAAFSVVLLGEMEVGPSEARPFCDFVRQGGLLIASRPGPAMAELFGLTVLDTRSEDILQYFAVDATTTIGRGIGPEPLQYHGTATEYALEGARALAHLYRDADTPSANPAVTVNQVGRGRAVAVAFDPAKSVVLTRQGNPRWADTEGDNIPGYRPLDLFSRTDGTTWFDKRRLRIPQADMLQRLLANAIIDTAAGPLPRMWYLPRMHKVLLVNAGDAEDDYGSICDPVLRDAASYGGAFTLYLRNIGIAKTTPAEEAAWRAAGHEVGVHVYADGAEGAGAEGALDEAYGRIVAELRDKFGHGSRTARNHTVDWTGWVEMAAIEAKHGTRMDLNYVHLFKDGDVLTESGYMFGTGLPQRMINEKGEMLDIYQQVTHFPDEWFADPHFAANATVEQAVEVIKALFEAAQAGYYSAFANGIHPIRYNGYDPITPKWPPIIWKYCRDHGIPSWSAEMLLDFVQARDAVRFAGITWKPGSDREPSTLEFDYHTASDREDLTVMIPLTWSGRPLRSLTADGRKLSWTPERITGIDYAMFAAPKTPSRIVAEYADP